jgi:hypothetical protein
MGRRFLRLASAVPLFGALNKKYMNVEVCGK